MTLAWLRTQRVALTGLALIAVLFSILTVKPAQAASGAATYMVYLNGTEIQAPYDPLVRRDGLLLPVEVLERAGIAVLQQGTAYSLTRGSLTLNGRTTSPVVTSTRQGPTPKLAAVTSGTHLFVPMELLPRLGVEVEIDGNLIFLDPWPEAAAVPLDNYASAYAEQNHIAYFRLANMSMSADLTLLTPAIVGAPEWTADPALRGRMLQLVQDYTLLQVQISNNDSRSINFRPDDITLVSGLFEQLDYTGRLIPIQGTLTGRLAPGTRTTAVLLFPRTAANELYLYIEGVSGSPATFWNVAVQ